jgi:hypothetical protein
VGGNKTRARRNGGRAEFSIHPEGDHEGGRTREVPQEDRCSSTVCTLTSVYILFCNANICALATYVPS